MEEFTRRLPRGENLQETDISADPQTGLSDLREIEASIHQFDQNPQSKPAVSTFCAERYYVKIYIFPYFAELTAFI